MTGHVTRIQDDTPPWGFIMTYNEVLIESHPYVIITTLIVIVLIWIPAKVNIHSSNTIGLIIIAKIITTSILTSMIAMIVAIFTYTYCLEFQLISGSKKQFLLDVWLNNYFPCKDLESSNWNNHLSIDQSLFQFGCIYICIVLSIYWHLPRGAKGWWIDTL